MQEKNIHRIFAIGLVLKGINAFLGMIGSLFFLITGSLTSLLQFVIQTEIPYFSAYAQLFISFYLFIHSVIKIVLIVGLLKNKLWAYQAGLIIFSLFAVYQIVSILISFSFFMTVITIIDLIVIWLTWHEYKIVKKQALHSQSS